MVFHKTVSHTVCTDVIYLMLWLADNISVEVEAYARPWAGTVSEIYARVS